MGEDVEDERNWAAMAREEIAEGAFVLLGLVALFGAVVAVRWGWERSPQTTLWTVMLVLAVGAYGATVVMRRLHVGRPERVAVAVAFVLFAAVVAAIEVVPWLWID